MFLTASEVIKVEKVDSPKPSPLKKRVLPGDEPSAENNVASLLIKRELPKEEKLQASLFDMLTENEPNQEIEVIEEAKDEPIIQQENLIINIETGEVLTQNNQINPFDDEVTTSLFSIFENTLEVK